MNSKLYSTRISPAPNCGALSPDDPAAMVRVASPDQPPLQVLQHLRGMAFGLDLGPNVLDLAFGVDDESGPLHAEIGAPVHALLDPDAKGLQQLLFRIDQQREVELVLGHELAVGLGVIRAGPKDRHTQILEPGNVVAEGTGFLGAPRRVVLGIEIDHIALTAQLLRADRAGAVRLQAEIRYCVTNLQHGGLLMLVDGAKLSGWGLQVACSWLLVAGCWQMLDRG